MVVVVVVVVWWTARRRYSYWTRMGSKACVYGEWCMCHSNIPIFRPGEFGAFPPPSGTVEKDEVESGLARRRRHLDDVCAHRARPYMWSSLLPQFARERDGRS